MATKQQIAVLGAAVLVAGAGAYFSTHYGRSTSRATPEKIAFLQEKLKKKEKQRLERFDKPAEAMRWAVDKRTGPIITRGPGANQPTGRTISPQMYLAAIEQARQMPVYSSANRSLNPPAPPGGLLGTWAPLGPTNQGGRTRQLLIDPNTPNTMYAAAVSGGVWKTTNGGTTWAPLTDLLIPNLAVNSMAFQPNNTQVIYAGTGEGFYNADGVRGAGVFKTTDGGSSWTQLASTANSNFYYVTDVVVSPRVPNRLYATTRTGIYRSNDAGATWTAMTGITVNNGCTDLAMQMKRATGFVFATCGTFAQGRVYRALDTPTSNFTEVFSTANQGRTSLAIAPSNENVIYAMAASNATGNYQDGLLGVFRSTANGNAGSWTTQVLNTNANKLNTVHLTNPVYAYFNACFGGSDQFYNQGWYDNVIAVDPLDSNRVWTGGIDLMRSDDGGATWGLASYWWFDQGDPNYAHADHHAIAFHPQYDGVGNKMMYVGNDGGVFRTNDARANVVTTQAGVCGTPPAGMVTWTELNTDYTSMQFYHGTAYPNGDFYFGGTQDNGTWRGAPASMVWTNLMGGDGGYTAVDTLGDANAANDVLFGEFTGLSIQKSTDGGANFADSFTGITDATDPGFAFIAPFDMNRGNRQHLWTGGWYIWRTTNQATLWTRASALTAGDGSITAVAANPINTDKIIVGMSDGYIHFTATGLTNTSATNWAQTRPRTVYVSSLAWDPNNEAIAYATYSSFTGPTVFRSTDSGATWTGIQGAGITALPLVPAHSIVVDPSDSNRLYVATDIGVFTSLDSGVNWYKENTGFANVQVEWLDINGSGTRRLHAFTHGRGAWRVDLVP